MLYRLGGGKQSRVEGGRPFVFLGDLLALFHDPVDRRTLLALGPLLHQLEDLFQPSDVLLGFAVVLLEGCFELLSPCRLRHLGQGGQNFLFGVENVLEGVVE